MGRINTRRFSDRDVLKGRTLHVAAIVGAVSVAGSMYAANQSAGAAKDAADAQSQSAQSGIAAQQAQFAQVQKMLAPYMQAGNGAVSAQQDLVGLNGGDAQQQAITQLQKSPYFQSQLQLGNTAILQNASATGGLRGGNTERALATFSPQLLAQTVQQQYQNLGGLTSIGQNAAAMTGNAGMQTGQGISSLLQQQGAAQAGGFLAQGRANAGMANGLAGAAGQYVGLGGNFGMTGATNGGTYDAGIDPYGNLGGAASAGDFSDARLKKNIVPFGMTARGNKLYRWDWKTGGSGMGVIAQEVEHIPGAVHADRDGLLKVDYTKV